MPLWKKKKAAESAAPLDVLRWKIVAVNILFAAMVVATLCFVAARQGKNALEEKHRLAFASLLFRPGTADPGDTDHRP